MRNFICAVLLLACSCGTLNRALDESEAWRIEIGAIREQVTEATEKAKRAWNALDALWAAVIAIGSFTGGNLKRLLARLMGRDPMPPPPRKRKPRKKAGRRGGSS